MLFCSIDSKAKSWKYGELRAEKKLLGLPSIAFLDADGTALVVVPSGGRTVEGFRRHGERAREYVRLRETSANGDRKAAAHFLRMQLEERQVSLAAAKRRRKAVEEVIDEKTAKVLDRMILHLQISTELRAKGQKGRAELGPRFWKMWKDGPNPGPRVGRGYWYAILEWAEREKKADMFAEALEAMRQSLAVTDPDATWVPNLLERYQNKLEQLRSKGG